MNNYRLDKIFWFFLFLYTDPGGYQKGYFNNNIWGSIDFSDVFILILLTIFILTPKSRLFNQRKTRIYLILLGIWTLYFTLGYGFINNSYSFIHFIIKNRFYYYNICISVLCIYYVQRNIYIFYKYLLFFSIVIFLMLFLTLLTPFELIPFVTMERKIFQGTRILLYSYSLMGFLIPIALAILFFKIKIKERNIIIFLGIFMLLTLVLSITRRHFIYTAFYFVIIYYLSTGLKIQISSRIFRGILFIFIGIIVLSFIFPSYLQIAKTAVKETFSVLSTDQTTNEIKEPRLSLTHPFITKKFKSNPWFGTGYDYNWYIAEGDEKGYEASDYPLLSALAMHGIIGLSFLLPLYIFLYSNVFKSLKYLKLNRWKQIFPDYYYFLIFIFFISCFTLQFLQYMNYFHPASNPRLLEWFLYLGMFIGVLNKCNEFAIFRIGFKPF